MIGWECPKAKDVIRLTSCLVIIVGRRFCDFQKLKGE